MHKNVQKGKLSETVFVHIIVPAKAETVLSIYQKNAKIQETVNYTI